MNNIDGRIIVGLWVIIAAFVLGAGYFFYLGDSPAQTKRLAFRWYTGIGGLLITLWFTLLGGLPGLLMAVCMYPLSAYWGMRVIRFCDACGATQFNQFVRARYCARCGADLDAQDQQRISETDTKH